MIEVPALPDNNAKPLRVPTEFPIPHYGAKLWGLSLRPKVPDHTKLQYWSMTAELLSKSSDNKVFQFRANGPSGFPGTPLLDVKGRQLLKERLLPMAAVITPNLDEASLLAELEIRGPEDLGRALDLLLLLGPGAALITGGHGTGDTLVDILRTADGMELVLESQRIATRTTHGTGCTFASALACSIAEGMTLEASARRAHEFVRASILAAPPLGKGTGPVNQAHALRGVR
jgi:hypothetical protein